MQYGMEHGGTQEHVGMLVWTVEDKSTKKCLSCSKLPVLLYAVFAEAGAEACSKVLIPTFKVLKICFIFFLFWRHALLVQFLLIHLRYQRYIAMSTFIKGGVSFHSTSIAFTRSISNSILSKKDLCYTPTKLSRNCSWLFLKLNFRQMKQNKESHTKHGSCHVLLISWCHNNEGPLCYSVIYNQNV